MTMPVALVEILVNPDRLAEKMEVKAAVAGAALHLVPEGEVIRLADSTVATPIEALQAVEAAAVEMAEAVAPVILSRNLVPAAVAAEAAVIGIPTIVVLGEMMVGQQLPKKELMEQL